MSGVLQVYVHEMFHPSFRGRAGRATIAQVVDEARIADCEPAELRPGHATAAQKTFDAANQHANLRGESMKE
jgi:hypothetical protein